MIPTSNSFSSRLRTPSIRRESQSHRIGSLHILFAFSYAVAVWLSMSVVYSGTIIAVAWPSIGMAVWWAVSCRSWRALGFMSLFVFAIPVTYLVFVMGITSSVTLFTGLSHVIAGPGLIPIMAFFEKILAGEPRKPLNAYFSSFTRIATPRHIYLLLIASLIMIPVAKGFSIVGFMIDGYDMPRNLYLSLILRDLAGVLAIAGPGIAITSSGCRGVDAAAIREFLGVVIVTAVSMVVIFGPGRNLPIMYLAMLPLYWSATRLPVSMAVIHSLMTSAATAFLAFRFDAGPFSVSESRMAQAAPVW